MSTPTIAAMLIPSMEPVRDAVERALRDGLADALDAVNAVSPTEAPDGSDLVFDWHDIETYRQAKGQDAEISDAAPAVVITSQAPEAVGKAANAPGGAATVWRGEIEIELFDYGDDPAILIRKLDRYAAAIYAVIVNPDNDNPIEAIVDVDRESFDLMQSEPAGVTLHLRAVSIAFAVTFWT